MKKIIFSGICIAVFGIAAGMKKPAFIAPPGVIKIKDMGEVNNYPNPLLPSSQFPPVNSLFSDGDAFLTELNHDGKLIAHYSKFPENGEYLNIVVKSTDDGTLINKFLVRNSPSKGIHFTYYKNYIVLNQSDKQKENTNLFILDPNGAVDPDPNTGLQKLKQITFFKDKGVNPICYMSSEKHPNYLVISVNSEDEGRVCQYHLYDFETNICSLYIIDSFDENHCFSPRLGRDLRPYLVFIKDKKTGIKSYYQVDHSYLDQIYSQKDLSSITISLRNVPLENAPILTVPVEDATNTSCQGRGEDEQNVLFLSSVNRKNTNALLQYNLTDKTWEEVYSDPNYDITAVWKDPKTREPFMLRLGKASPEEHLVALNDDGALLLDLLHKNFGKNTFISWETCDDSSSMFIFSLYSPAMPKKYVLWDKPNNSVSLLYDSKPELSSYRSSPQFRLYEPSVNAYLFISLGNGNRLNDFSPTILRLNGDPFNNRTINSFRGDNEFWKLLGFNVAQYDGFGKSSYGKIQQTGADYKARLLVEQLAAVVAFLKNNGFNGPVIAVCSAIQSYIVLKTAEAFPGIFEVIVGSEFSTSICDLMTLNRKPTYIYQMQPFERFLEIKYNEGSCRPTCSNEDWGTVNLEALSTQLFGGEYANNSRVHGNSPVIVQHLNSKGVKSCTVTFGKANGHGSTLPVNDMVECKLLSNFVLNVLSEKYPGLTNGVTADYNPDCLLTEDDLDRATIQNVDDVKKMFVKDQDGLLSLQ